MEIKIKNIILIAVITLSLVCSASAQLKTFNGTPNLSQTLTFDLYDGSSGPLQAIQVKFVLNSHDGQLILDNDSAEPAAGTFEFGSIGDISSTDVPLLNSSFQLVTVELDATHSGPFGLAGDLAPVTGDFNPNPPDGMQYDGGNESDSDSGFIAPALFAQYTGAGTFDIVVDVLQWQDFGGVSGIEWAVTPVNVDGYIEVIYIPEPATLLLLGLGGLVLRKRN